MIAFIQHAISLPISEIDGRLLLPLFIFLFNIPLFCINPSGICQRENVELCKKCKDVLGDRPPYKLLPCYLAPSTDTCRYIDSIDLEYPNFNPKHGFLSSIEAEIISFLPNKAAIFIFGISCPSFDFSKWLPIQI